MSTTNTTTNLVQKDVCKKVITSLLVSSVIYDGSQTTVAGKKLDKAELTNYINNKINTTLSKHSAVGM